MAQKLKTNIVQQNIFSLLPAENTIIVEPLSAMSALRPGMVKILITKRQGDKTTEYRVPGQWTTEEAAYLLHEIKGITWQLDVEGYPIDYVGVIGICEDFCKNNKKND